MPKQSTRPTDNSVGSLFCYTHRNIEDRNHGQNRGCDDCLELQYNLNLPGNPDYYDLPDWHPAYACLNRLPEPLSPMAQAFLTEINEIEMALIKISQGL